MQNIKFTGEYKMININSVSFRYAGSNTENLTNFTLRIERANVWFLPVSPDVEKLV